MSSSKRGRPIQNIRGGRVALRHGPRPITQSDKEYVKRVVKRHNIANGYEEKKMPFEWNYYEDSYPEFGGTVEAFTRSEARAKIKEEVGLERGYRLTETLIIDKGARVERDK